MTAPIASGWSGCRVGFAPTGKRRLSTAHAKNGVRYRFYISSALLRGQKAQAGSVGRVSATEIESAVLAALQPHQEQAAFENEPDRIKMLERVVVTRDQLLITTAGSSRTTEANETTTETRIAWSANTRDSIATLDSDAAPEGASNESLIQSVVRAHVWIHLLREGTYVSIEKLAEANQLHPKVVRQALRLAFLSPDVTSAILEGRQPTTLSLAQIPKLLSLAWTAHRCLG
jgi:hypothetical protein